VIQVLKQKGVWDSALFVVMGDAGPGDELPYDPAGPLTEDRLGVPLLARMPGRLLAGRDVPVPVTAMDVATTFGRALDVLPAGRVATDLAQRAESGSNVEATAQIATLPGRYSTRNGPWLLRGELGATPRLCGLDVDPACAVDAFEERSIAARTGWISLFEGELQRVPEELGTASRTPVELDPDTRAALVVWGDIPP
jgi:hypothetical protein